MDNKNKEKPSNVLLPQNIQFEAEKCPHPDSTDYLCFASNGMTDNEKIDDHGYYDAFLSEDGAE